MQSNNRNLEPSEQVDGISEKLTWNAPALKALDIFAAQAGGVTTPDLGINS